MNDRNIAVTGLLDSFLTQVQEGKLEEAYRELKAFIDGRPEYIDERFQAEMRLLIKIAEYTKERESYSFLLGVELAYRYCEAKYAAAGKAIDNGRMGQDLPDRDIIWFCWLQGMENAPRIVKMCFESLHRLGRNIIVLSEENLRQYVSFPEYIWLKYGEGAITRAHFSDLVRLELLTQRGGTWIDATTFISGTEQILPILEDEPLFMYRSGQVSKHIIFDNWFIHASRVSRILEATRQMLLNYWQGENEAINYYIMHLFTTISCNLYPEEYYAIPLFSNEPCHVLQYSFSRPYQKKRWEQIKSMSDVHKLTYKLEDSKGEQTLYEFFCNNMLD